ncbi:unnamed protein product, partial [Symbiodinium necroappetens]
ITFTFSRDGDEVHLSGLAVAREESKAKVKAKAKSKKEGKYDEFGRRIDKLKKKEVSSSDEDLDDFCPSSKKNADFERELRRMKKKVREGMTEQQREEMENPWLHTQISDQERELKKQMFRSFYQEQYARLKNKAQPDYKQYEKSDPTTGQSVTGGNLTAEGGHRPLPRPKGVKLPADFRKQVGRISQKELLEKHSCKGQRMLISVYGDLFDVSDRPDKYGPDGPYWYMTGKDITWALMSGEDTEETMDKFYDVFKIQPAEAADRRLQGLMSWWAFYEKEYGKPVGRNTAYDKEWGLPAPPHMADGLTPLLWGSLFYSHTVLRLPDAATLLDLQVSLSGCDVLTVPGSGAEAHLSYWHLLGSGSMEIVNHTLRVHAMYNRKFVMLGCVFVLHLPEFRAGSAQFNFNFVNMTVQQDGFSEGEDSQTSKQMASVSISDLHARGGFHLEISTTARTTLSEIRAASLQVHVKGGYIGLHHSRAEHGKADIHAQDAMVSISTKGVPVKAEIPDEIFKYAALSAPTVHQASNATGRLRLYQLSGLSADGWIDEALEVRIDGEGSTAYIQASDPLTSEMCKAPLQVVRGSVAAQEGTVLLPATRELLGKLSKWLHQAKGKQEPRYVVNVHLLAPNAPTGMLKLLSSTVYHAMSLSLASIVTGGMLRPRVLRIVAPVSGMRWLFPQDACDPGIGNLDDAQLRFGEQQLQAISPEVDIVGMNLTSARWIWDPKGSKAYVFDKVDAKSTYFWRPRLLTVKDFWIFLAASGITLSMGLAAGVVVLLILGFLVIPSLREELRKIATFRTASYRMQCSKDSETWALHPSMVHWPTRGVLLRWAKRPKAKRFSTICCQARLWPDAASLEGFKGIVRTRHIAVDKLPCPEEFPDIRCFLFVVDVKQDVGGKQYYRKEYDVELAAIGKLQAEQEQPPLHAGRPYQFQVIAFDDAGALIETSAWSRPTMIDAPRKFVELPLLLWQGWCRILPSSTFNHFLNKHCAILPEDPTMRIRLKRLRLTLVAPGPPSLAGAPPSVAGTEAQVQEVQVCFSAGGNFKATDHVKLPSQDERSEKRLVEPLSKVFPGSNRIDPKQGCIVLDAFSKELELDVGQDVGDQLTIEVSVTSEDGTETTAAKWRHNWSYLLDVFMHRRSATQELADEIVLLDGRTPVAFLSAQFEISNPCLPSTARPPPASNDGFPRIFDRIRPGCVVYWSESVKLDWDVPAAVDRQDIEVEVVLVGNEVDVSKLEQGRCQPKRKCLSTKLGSMQLRSGQHSLVMCSSHLVRDGIMCCHLQAKTLMNRKLQQQLEEINVPGEEEQIGDFESVESLLGNQMEEVYMQLQLHYSTAIRLLAHRDSMARRYQEEIERLKTQMDAMKPSSAKEREAKQMKILVSQVKLYKDKYLERDKSARAIEEENYELREQLAALKTVGVSYAYSQADTSMLMRPGSPHSPSKPEPLAYAAYAPPADTGDPLARLEKAQMRLDTWASQNRASLKRNLTGLVNVQELPNMELPGAVATRGAYGPGPPILPELDDDEIEKPEDEPAEEEEPQETAYYIRASKNRVQEEETGLGLVMQKLRGYWQAFFFQGERDMQDTYYKTGLCQYIARSQTFENATMAVIAVSWWSFQQGVEIPANSVWLGVDVTYNDQLLLINSQPIFIIMENLFCTYFFLEVWPIVIRFGAFRRKCNVFRDYWFVFDLALVLAMVLDTWVLLAIMASSDMDVSVVNSSSLRLLRIIRISRLARVARILRSVPEMMILFQGMGVASRSVICTVSLLVILVYVFALVFMQLLRGTAAGDAYFPSITKGMFALFFHGCLGEFLPNLAEAVFDEGIDVGFFLILFVFLGPLTVMNMVVAVLVHVVSSVATLQQKNQHNGQSLSQLRQIPLSAMAVFLEVGVDVIAILKDPDIIFGGYSVGEVRLPIDELLDEVITLRGSNFTTVKDLVQLKNQLVRELRASAELDVQCLLNLRWLEIDRSHAHFLKEGVRRIMQLLKLSMSLGSHASILSISALASLLPGIAGDVSCGGHMALLCSRCVESQPAEDAANFCNGDCRWTGEKCVLRADRLINCGGHRAKTCAQCPDGHGGGWCHGWLHLEHLIKIVGYAASAGGSMQVALVTGASSGIGAAIAEKMAETYRLALLARSESKLQDLAKKIEQARGERPLALVADVTDRAAMEAATKEMNAKLGPADVLVHCAGMWSYVRATADAPAVHDHHADLVAVHCNGTLNAVEVTLPGMLAKKDGQIMLITSENARQVWKGLTVYSACKFWKQAYATGLRMELEGSGIRVLTVQPGEVDTPGRNLVVDAEGDRMFNPLVNTDSIPDSMPPASIADAVAYALSQPPVVRVNEILIQ